MDRTVTASPSLWQNALPLEPLASSASQLSPPL
ncbi:Uncharacterised protein [Vibrio cholerae]|nr:Uncharacterised protein [Vibrio cholerae]